MTKDEQIEILEANNADLEHDIRNAEDRIEELEDLLNEALSDKEYEESQKYSLEDDISDLEDEIQSLTILNEELQDQLDECESPTVGMSISQVSCYETFMEILHALPKPAHEIEEELIKMFLNGK